MQFSTENFTFVVSRNVSAWKEYQNSSRKTYDTVSGDSGEFLVGFLGVFDGEFEHKTVILELQNMTVQFETSDGNSGDFYNPKTNDKLLICSLST